MKAKCNKTLINDMGEENFTKGKEYEFAYPYQNDIPFNERTVLIDNQGETHGLDLWYKHFKEVK